MQRACMHDGKKAQTLGLLNLFLCGKPDVNMDAFTSLPVCVCASPRRSSTARAPAIALGKFTQLRKDQPAARTTSPHSTNDNCDRSEGEGGGLWAVASARGKGGGMAQRLLMCDNVVPRAPKRTLCQARAFHGVPPSTLQRPLGNRTQRRGTGGGLREDNQSWSQRQTPKTRPPGGRRPRLKKIASGCRRHPQMR